MRGCDALGSRYRRRGAGHYRGIVEVALRPAALALLALLLTACAATPRVPHGAATAPSSSSQRPPADAAPDARNAMIDNAMAMLGQPYRWGGAAPGGFDCSGLVFYAAAGAGVHLPRTASEQRRIGSAVSLKHLEPGDLIFMHLSRKELHVGIALDNSRFIHAPSSGGRVRIDSIAATPYSAGFIGARRVIEAGERISNLSSTAKSQGFP
jgi:cell wall-associated NlpC family hydrolase